MSEKNEVTLVKKTVDMPVDLFEKIMAYAHKNKIYKFGPALIQIVKDALDEK